MKEIKNSYTKQAIDNFKNDEMTCKLAEKAIIAAIVVEIFFKNIGKGIKKSFKNLKEKLLMLKLRISFELFISRRERKSKKYIKQIEHIQQKKEEYFKKNYRTIDKRFILTEKQKQDNIKHSNSVERIDDMLDLLHIIWTKPANDQLRLGQLILNVAKEDELYYLEDEELYKRLKKEYIVITRDLKL